MPANPTTSSTLKGADFLTFASLDRDQVGALFKTAAAVKSDRRRFRAALEGKSVILLFEKPSLRTRVTFELGPVQMGGAALYFDHSKDRIGQRESVRDYAKNLERWFDLIVARVYSQQVLEEFAAESSAPVINALSDRYHPCQALADYFTLAERFGGIDGLKGLRVAFVGDGNNVCHSLMHGAAILGVYLTVITPPGYEPDNDIAAECRGPATLTTDPKAVRGCKVVYTDTWVSMGKDAEAVERQKAFKPYQVNETLMPRDALFMHCMPAHRGHEVTDGVMDSDASIVYDQAENRMHVQNALMLHVLGRLEPLASEPGRSSKFKVQSSNTE